MFFIIASVAFYFLEFIVGPNKQLQLAILDVDAQMMSIQ